MKKIFVIISVVVLILSCKAQAQVRYSMTTQLYQNYLQYQNYLTNGPVNKAQQSGEVLTRGISLWDGYVAGTLTGRAGIMDSCFAAFQILYGKNFAAPEISLGALSYLKLDSISFNNGGSWIHYIYPKDSTIKWIRAYGGGTGNGNVSVSGTPIRNQLAIWVNDSTIKGSVVFYDSLSNIGIGDSIFKSNTSGDNNTGLGHRALRSNTTGLRNTGIGDNALSSNTTGMSNTGIGTDVLSENISGTGNTGTGRNTLAYSTGSYNTGDGISSLQSNTTGSYNIGLGSFAGYYNTTQSNRIYINSLDRTNIKGDSTKSIIYGYQSSDTTKQKLYINADTRISGKLTVVGSSNIADTNKVQSMINKTAKTLVDTLDHVTQAELSAISVNGSKDSSWISATTDTLKTKVLNLKGNYIDNIYQGTGEEILFKSNNITSVAIVSTGIQGWGSYAPQMNNIGIRFLPNASDVNTGFTWLSSDKLTLEAGGQNILTSEYTGGKRINNLEDSANVIALKATRGRFDSIWDGTKWNKKLVSFNSNPTDSAVVGMKSDGAPFYLSIKNGTLIGTSGILDPDSVSSNSEWLKLFSADGKYYKLVQSHVDTAYFGFDCSDETTSLTGSTSTIIYTIHVPFSGTLVGIKATVTTAPTGQPILVDIHTSTTGSTILSTKVMIDATETTSLTAATPYVISNATLANDAILTIYTDQVGSSVHGAGLKLLLKIIR